MKVHIKLLTLIINSNREVNLRKCQISRAIRILIENLKLLKAIYDFMILNYLCNWKN